MAGGVDVVDELAVDQDLEDAPRARAQLYGAEHRRPTRTDRGCRTDSFIEVVSRDAVFDHHVVRRVQHLFATIPKSPPCRRVLMM